jgi:hypothetical protein
MGRRPRGSRAIAVIKIDLGSREEVFRLEDETLVGRRACMKRARDLHDEAFAYIMQMNAANSVNNDARSTIRVDQPNHVLSTSSPPLSPRDPGIREPVMEATIIPRDLTQDMASLPGSRVPDEWSARDVGARDSLWDEDTWGGSNFLPDTHYWKGL